MGHTAPLGDVTTETCLETCAVRLRSRQELKRDTGRMRGGRRTLRRATGVPMETPSAEFSRKVAEGVPDESYRAHPQRGARKD